MRVLAVLACAREKPTERLTACTALWTHSYGALDVEAGAAAGELLAARRVRDRGRVLLEEAVELVALCRARPRVLLVLIRRLLFRRSGQELVDVGVRRSRRRGVLCGFVDELVGGHHQRGREILRRRRVERFRLGVGGRWWFAWVLRPPGRAFILTPLGAARLAVDDDPVLGVGESWRRHSQCGSIHYVLLHTLICQGGDRLVFWGLLNG